MGQWAGYLPESAARLMTIAHTNSQRLVRLINDILDIEKIEFGRVVFQLSRVDVGLLVEQVLEANRGFAEGYDVRLRLDDGSSSGRVNADPDRLAQVITNLISNAIKFSPAKGEVVVKVDNSGQAVRISVRDHGPGIPQEFKPRMFNKFAQADATSTREKGGTGLGLSIAKQLVDRLGGEIGFDAAPGGGTILFVELPSWEAAADWEIDVDAQPGIPRILVCAKDRDTAALLRARLRQAGFAADFAYSTTAGVERAKIALYVAFLVDLQLTDDDGINLMTGLRTQKQHQDAPIIVVSLDPDQVRDPAVSSDISVLGWLYKPVDINRLVGVVRISIPLDAGRRPRILHVDKDHAMLAVVNDALRMTADVVSADSLTSARSAIAADRIDLAVLDISVGAKSGLDLLPDLRDGSGDAIPVIVFYENVDGAMRDGQIQAALEKSGVPLRPDDVVSEAV